MKKRVFLDEFCLEPSEEKKVLALSQKVEVCLEPELDRIHVADEGRRPSAVEVVLKNGEIFSARKDVAKGWPEDPLSGPELREKFNRLVRGILSETRREALFETIASLEQAPDVSQLVEKLIC